MKVFISFHIGVIHQNTSAFDQHAKTKQFSFYNNMGQSNSKV